MGNTMETAVEGVWVTLRLATRYDPIRTKQNSEHLYSYYFSTILPAPLGDSLCIFVQNSNYTDSLS